MAISKLSMPFVDGSTVIDANKMNAIVSKINELVDKSNDSTSGGGGTDSGGGSDTPQPESRPNLFDASTSIVAVSIDSSTGAIAENPSACTSDYIAVKPNTQYTFKARYVVAWFDSSKTFISASPTAESSTKTLTSPSNAAYCRFSFAYKTYNVKDMIMNEGSTLVADTSVNSNYPPSMPNLFVASTAETGKGVSSSNGNVVDKASDTTSDYISVKQNTNYTFLGRFVVAWYNSSKTFISASPSSEKHIKTLVSPDNAAYCRFSYATGNYSINDMVMNEGSTLALNQ